MKDVVVPRGIFPAQPPYTHTDTYQEEQYLRRRYQEMVRTKDALSNLITACQMNDGQLRDAIRELQQRDDEYRTRLTALTGAIYADLHRLSSACPHRPTCNCPKGIPSTTCPRNPFSATIEAIVEFGLDDMTDKPNGRQP